MPSNLFIKMSQDKIDVAYNYEVAEDEIHVTQLQRIMMREVLSTPESEFITADCVTQYLDNSRQWSVSAAVALFPAWIFHTNQCAFMDLNAVQLSNFVANCEAMFSGEKFYYNDGCGIDAGAGEAHSAVELLTNCIKFNQMQGSEFTAEDIDRFYVSGVLEESDRRDMLEVLAEAA